MVAEAEEKECIPTTVYMGLAGWGSAASRMSGRPAPAGRRTEQRRSEALLGSNFTETQTQTQGRERARERTAQQRTRRPGAAPRARHGIILIGRRWSDSDEGGGGGDIAGVHSQRTSSHPASQKQSQDSYVVGPAELSINHFNTIQHKRRYQAIPVVVTTTGRSRPLFLNQIQCLLGLNDHPAGTPYL